MADEIPIDIHIPKLVEWLISRQHCRNNWQSELNPIREKINAALHDMPEHKDIAELLSGSYLNYFHCCQIVEILKDTEADSKNLFGRYGSQRMKDWQDIVRLYQKDNLYLAETSNLLYGNVKYEIPFLKKQLARSNHIKLECEKKIADYNKTAASAQRELENLRKQFGVGSGKNIRSDLITKVADLDEHYQEIASDCKSLISALKYFAEFKKHILGSVSESHSIIQFVIERGNVTAYEYIYKRVPDSVVLPKVFADDSADAISDEGIDWGDTANNDEEEIEIDWGADNIVGEQDTNYDVACVDNGTGAANGQTVSSNCESTPLDNSNVAKGAEALGILDSPKTREEFTCELLELRTFLKLRTLELGDDTNSSNDVPTHAGLPAETKESVEAMLQSVLAIYHKWNNGDTQLLWQIKHSNRYIEKVETMLNQKVTSIEKILASIEAVNLKKEETEKSEPELRARLRKLISHSRLLQEKIEDEISKKYRNRPVNLLGGL